VGSTEQSSAPDGPIAAGAAEAAAERLVGAVDRLARQVAHWQPARWSTAGGARPTAATAGGPGAATAGDPGAATGGDPGAAAAGDPGAAAAGDPGAAAAGDPGAATVGDPGAAAAGSRGDRVHALVQRLADRGALAERRPAGVVPRLNDLVLPDQLRVVADDLMAAGAPGDVMIAAADDVDAVRRTL
jgi:hypothetical protein